MWNTVVTEAVKALSAEEITELCLRHTLYDWSAQAGLKPMAVASAKGVRVTTVDGRLPARADIGHQWRPDPARRLSPGRARAVRPPRDPDDLRRGHERLRPYGAVVCGRPLGRRPRPDHAGQRPD